MMTRREACKTMALAAGALAVAPAILSAQSATESAAAGVYPFQVPPLGYAFEALEPFFDAQTMQIHHDKHHGAYVENLNKALKDAPTKFQEMSLERLLMGLDEMPDDLRTAVRNQAGGHFNHSFWWPMLKKNENGQPAGDLAKAIDSAFGSFSGFQEKFTTTASKLFGSGWTWLVANGGKLELITTPNQDSPISKNLAPILGVDIWEHAYYLKYQNRRPDYLKAFWNVINWDYVTDRYKAAL
jgi:Fe-Mn family superoxide dismutase